MKPTFSATPADLRGWLAEHHAEARELWLIAASERGQTVAPLPRPGKRP